MRAKECYAGAPTDGSAWKRGDCVRRVVRGSGFSGNPRNIRAAERNWGTINYYDYEGGFRVARSLTS